MQKTILRSFLIFFYIALFFSTGGYHALAGNKTYNLHVAYRTVNFSGCPARAIAINDQIPGPTLHFKEGDEVTLNVHNHLDKGTTIHWHGLLLPWYMDGVEHITQEGIPPGKYFSYKFKIRQSGTYWYHSHAGLQEQQGQYGAIIIDPLTPSPFNYDRDYVIVLSDWSNTDPDQIFTNLKKAGDYYTPDFPLQASLARFLGDYTKGTSEQKSQLLESYLMMQSTRMSPYDISDIAYDAFLLNGRPKTRPWTAPAKVGDTIRLRFIGAGASTIFRVKIPGTSMKVVNLQGHDVTPYPVNDFTIAPGETIDVLIKIEKECPYIIYAESSDTVGAAVGALLTQPFQKANYQAVKPFPTPSPMMMGHGIKKHTQEGHKVTPTPAEQEHISSDHSEHQTMSSQSKANEAKHPSSPEASLTQGTKYQGVKAAFKTNDPRKPVHVIKIALSGYMSRYMWFINDRLEEEADPILIEPGKRYRLIFTNSSMMHHPMHIHGHFFILRNGHGAYDPLLHTIEVPPGATAVADFDADADGGQWFFHCHHLYHMVAGMARTFRYTTFMEDYEKDKDKLCAPSSPPPFVKRPVGHRLKPHQASSLDIGYDPYHNIQKANLNVLLGWDKHKLQLYSEDSELTRGKVESADLDISYWYLLSEFWAVKAGANYFYKPSKHPYWQPMVGIEGLFSYFIYTNLRTYLHEGSVKFDLQVSRDTQLAHNFYLTLGTRSVFATHAVQKDQIGRGLNYIEYIVKPYYMLTPSIAVFFEFDYTQDYGNLKKIVHKLGDSASEKVFMGGISLLY